eukprot:10778111-Prorocentrum_lima.AAC.1
MAEQACGRQAHQRDEVEASATQADSSLSVKCLKAGECNKPWILDCLHSRITRQGHWLKQAVAM